MFRKSAFLVAFAFVLALPVTALAQTTQPGSEVDVEVYNPIDGSNQFCVAPGGTFEARVYVRPGWTSISCDLSCSPPSVPGGSANIATGVIDLEFDGTTLSYVNGSIQNNGGTAAVQGLAQEQNLADDRIGWALAGTWSTPANPASTLLSPCDMQFLAAPGWLFGLQFQATGTGSTTIHLRRETDAAPFALSFADICGTEAFKQSNGGIDEVKDGLVMISNACSDLIFFDTFGTGDTGQWTRVTSSE
jgi:hypothetical protein